MIKLSIITICYNDLKNLKATYESILNKPNFVDWYVVDGNSNDGTQTFLESQSLTSGFVSENDNGIADAFNKGIELIEEKDSFVLFLFIPPPLFPLSPSPGSLFSFSLSMQMR